MQIEIKPDSQCLHEMIERALDDLDTPRPLTRGMIECVLSEVVRDAYTLGTIAGREAQL